MCILTLLAFQVQDFFILPLNLKLGMTIVMMCNYYNLVTQYMIQGDDQSNLQSWKCPQHGHISREPTNKC